MIKKRWLSTILSGTLALSMAFGLAACDRDPEPDPGPGPGPEPNPPIEQPMDISEFVNTLMQDEYTSDQISGNYGLSDPKSVGVRADGRETAKYAAAADSSFSDGAVFDVVSYIASEGSDGAGLSAAFEAAKTYNEENGEKVKIVLPNRTLDVDYDDSSLSDGTYTFVLSGFDGLTVAGGEESVVCIDTGDSWHGGFSFVNCTDVCIDGLRLDYKTLPSLKGIVQGADAENLQVTLKVPDSMTETYNALRDNAALGGTLYSYIDFDAYTDAPKEDGALLIYSDNMIESYEFTGGGVIEVKFAEGYRNTFTQPLNGDYVALGFAMYGNNGMNFSGGSDITVENSAVYACPGMAVTVSNVENFYANRFDVSLLEDRAMTSTADGYHITSCTGEVEITNCIIENTHDDALNIKAGYYYSLSGTEASSRTLHISRRTSEIPAPQAEEELRVYAAASFELRGVFTVVSSEATASGYDVVVEERVSGSVDWTGCVVTNVSAVPDFLFSDNIVRNKRNRGILVQIPGSVIENNSFENVAQGAVMIHSSLDQFNEATMPSDVTVRNNKFVNNGYLLEDALTGSISVFAIAENAIVAPAGTIYGMQIENNFIARSGNAGISLRGVGKYEDNETNVANNLFYNVARVSSSEETECALHLVNCAEINVTDNYNYNTLGSETFAGINALGETDPDYIYLEGNYNLNYREASGEALIVNVAKTDTAITVDGDVSEWADIGTEIEIRGSSLATGDEILPADYQDYFDVLMAKLTWTDDGIYFAFDLKDNALYFSEAAGFWNGDCVELLMTTELSQPNADMLLYRNDADTLQIAMGATWQKALGTRVSDKFSAGFDQIIVSVVQTDYGYRGEMFIPFALADGMKASIDSGSPIAAAIIFADSGRADINRTRLQIGNVPHFVETYKTKTEKMPQYLFVEEA